ASPRPTRRPPSLPRSAPRSSCRWRTRPQRRIGLSMPGERAGVACWRQRSRLRSPVSRSAIGPCDASGRIILAGASRDERADAVLALPRRPNRHGALAVDQRRKVLHLVVDLGDEAILALLRITERCLVVGRGQIGGEDVAQRLVLVAQPLHFVPD